MILLLIVFYRQPLGYECSTCGYKGPLLPEDGGRIRAVTVTPTNRVPVTPSRQVGNIGAGNANSANMWVAKGDAAQGKGEFQEASEAYQRALTSDPTNISALLGLSLTAAMFLDFDEQQSHEREVDNAMKRVLALRPNDPRLWGLQARIDAAHDRYEDDDL